MHIRLYILKQIVTSCLVVIGVLTASVWMILSIKIIQLALSSNASLDLFWRLMVNLIPTFLPMVFPLGVLAGLLFSYNRMVQESELIVMQACGLSPGQLGLPALIVVTGVVIISLVLTLFISPVANREVVHLQQLMRVGLASAVLREGEFTSVGTNLTFYIRERRSYGEFHGVFIDDRRNPDRPAVMVAEEGTFVGGEAVPRVLLRHGNRQEIDQTSGRVSELSFERYTVELERPAATPQRLIDPREQTTAEILSGSAYVGLDARRINRLTVEMHQRFALPFLVLAMGAIALLAMLRGEFSRRGWTKRVFWAAFAAVVMQLSTIALLNVSVTQPYLLLLSYVPPLLPIMFLIVFLRRGDRYRDVRVSV